MHGRAWFLFVLALSTGVACAQQVEWTGAASGSWTNPANWQGGVVPTAGNSVVFSNVATANLTTTLDTNFALSQLIVADPAGAVTIGLLTNSLTLNGGIDLSAATAGLTINTRLGTTAAQEWTVASGRQLTLGATVSNQGNRITLGGDGTFQFNSSINGGGIVVKQGNGTARADAGQNFSGGLVVSGGTWQVGGNIFGGNYLPASGNTITVYAASTLYNSGYHSLGSGNERIFVDGGTWRLDHEQYTRYLTMRGGTVTNTAAAELRSGYFFQNAQYDFLASATPAQLGVNVAVRGDGVSTIFNVADGAASPDLDVTAALYDSGLFRKTGAGMMQLSGVAQLSGTMQIDAGEIRAGGADRLSWNSVVALNGTGAVLNLSGNNQQVRGLTGTAGLVQLAGATLTVSNASGAASSYGARITDAGGVTKLGAGSFTLSGTNDYTGATTVGGGTLYINGALTGGGNVDVNAGGTLAGNGNLGTSGVVVNDGGFLSHGSSSINAGTLTVGTAILNNGATLRTTLNGTNAGIAVTTADFLVTGGTNRIDVAAFGIPAVGTYTLVDYSGSLQGAGFGAFVLGNVPGRATASLVDNTANSSVDLTLSGPFDPLTWTAAVSTNWDIGTTVNWTLSTGTSAYAEGDIVNFDDTAATGAVGIVTAVSPAQLTVSNNALAYTFAGAGINGGGDFIKQGAGTVTVINANGYLGTTFIEQGVLRASNALALGSAAGFTIVSNGAALDVNGQNLGDERVTIAGAGPDGLGAVLNSGGQAIPGIKYLTLSADATVGGASRWDVRPNGALDLQGHTLTKTGANYIAIVYTPVSNGTIDVGQGTLSFHGNGSPIATDVVVRARAGSSVEVANFGGTPTLGFALQLAGGTLTSPNGSGFFTFRGPIDVQQPGTIYIDGGDDLQLTNAINGSAALTGTGGGYLYLTADNPYSGTLTVSNSALWLGNNTANGLVSGPVVIPGTTLFFYRTTPSTFSNSITGGGSLRHYPGAAAATILGTNVLGSIVFSGNNAANPLVIAGRSSNTVSGSVQTDGNTTYGRLLVQDQAYINCNNVMLGEQVGRSGDVIQHGGTVVVNNEIRVAHWPSETSSFTLGGGSFRLTSSSGAFGGYYESAGMLNVGVDGTGLFIQTGGVASAEGILLDARGETTGTDYFILNGGTFNLGYRGIVSGNYNANTTYSILLGGGTLGAQTNWSSSKLITLSGTNGAATFDSGAFTITLSGVLSGTGGLTKTGSGTLSLSAPTNTYSGPTTVSTGTLLVTSVFGAGPVAVQGGRLKGTATFPGAGAVASNATIEPGAVSAGRLNFGSLGVAGGASFNVFGGGTSSFINVTSTNGFTLPVAGTATVSLLSLPSGSGPFTVFDYAGTVQGGTVAANLAAAPTPPRATLALTDNVANSSVDLTVVSLGESIKWTGAVNTNWNIGATTNWVTDTSAQNTAYLQPGPVGDLVLFDDTAAGNFTVNIPAAVTPMSVTVSNNANDYTLSGQPIAGATGLRKAGAARLTINTTNTFSGATTLEGGTLTLASEVALGTTPGTATPGQLTIGAGATLDILATTAISANRGIAVGPTSGTGSGTIGVASGTTLSIGSIIANAPGGTGALIKAGSGTMNLNRPNTFRGGMVVNGGLVNISPGDYNLGVPAGTLIEVNSGSTLDLVSINTLSGVNLSVTTGSVARFSGFHEHIQNVTLAGGTFRSFGTGKYAGQDLIIEGDLTVTGGTVSYIILTNGMALSGTRTFTIGDATDDAAPDLVVDANLRDSGAIVKTGAGTVLILTNCTYPGNTTINGGAIIVSGKLYKVGYTTGPTVTLNTGGTLQLNSFSYDTAGSLGELAFGNGRVVLNGGTVEITGPSEAIARGFTVDTNGGAFRVTTSGQTVTLQSGAESPNFPVGGVLALGGAGNLRIEKPVINNGALVGGLVKDGTGTVTLAAVNTFTGPTIVSNGTFVLEGQLDAGGITVASAGTLAGTGTVASLVTSDGTVAPGTSAGSLTAIDYNQNAGGTLTLEIGGTTAGFQYDQFIVANAATLSGTVTVQLINGYVPTTNDVFDVLTATSVTGAFTATNLPALSGGDTWVVTYLPNGVRLTITNAPSISGFDLYASVITNATQRSYADDPDNDGYANLLEYVTGGNPNAVDTNARMGGGRTNSLLTLKFMRATNATDATLIVEGSYSATNNAGWIGIATNAGGSWGGATNVAEAGTGNPVNVTVEDSATGATNRFLRLRVTRP